MNDIILVAVVEVKLECRVPGECLSTWKSCFMNFYALFVIRITRERDVTLMKTILA